MGTVDGMDAREALARIRDLHRHEPIEGTRNEYRCAECSRDSDNWAAQVWPCPTRDLCDQVLGVWT